MMHYLLRSWLMMIVAALSLMFCCGCQPNTTAANALIRHDAPVLPTPGPVRSDTAIATVNGQPVLLSIIEPILIDAYGRKVLDEYLLYETVRQYAAARGVTLSDADSAQRRWAFMAQLAPDRPAAEQRAMLSYMLQRRGLSAAEFDLILARRALLDELIDRRGDMPTITDAQITAEYERQYGPRVELRQITVSSLSKAETAVRRLAAGDDFAAVAADLCQDETLARNGGLMRPFSARDEQVPAAVIQAGFALETPGDRSGIVSYLDTRAGPALGRGAVGTSYRRGRCAP